MIGAMVWVVSVMMRVVTVIGTLLAGRQLVPVMPGATGNGGRGRRGSGSRCHDVMMIVMMMMMVVVVTGAGR